jgi:hypothetical protein
MSQQELTIIDAAYTIRYHLEKMLNHAEAETMLRELNLILKNRESDEDSEEQISELLEQNETTRKWTEDFLNLSDDTRKSYSKLPGDRTVPIGMEKYVCPEPHCPEYAYKQKPGEKLRCLVHKIPLKREDE